MFSKIYGYIYIINLIYIKNTLYIHTLRCLIWGGQNKQGGWRSLLNLITGRVKINGGVGIPKYLLISAMNEKKT